MIKEYNTIMWEAVKDTLQEMYFYAIPSVDWKQRMQDAKDGKVSAPSINFETLYKQELENNSALEIEVLNLKEQVNKLADKINAAKAALN